MTAPSPPELPDFPVADEMPTTPALLSERGFFLRAATRADLDWLCALYASTRAEEMSRVPWPEAMKRAFVANQFALQHRHYMAHYGDADFLIAEGRDGPVGRYYLRRRAPEHVIVDISLLPEVRGQGLGRALIEASQAEARALGRGIHLHVQHANPGARRLYERLRFVPAEDIGTHLKMRWAPPIS